MRLIGADGEQLGIVDTPEALRRAQEADLDLVEVAANSKPPVTRMLDYSKYKYEQEQKQKQARKHQQQVNIREIKLRPKIATHDYDTKKGHVERFLKHGDKVKVTIMFRGREQAHPERGRALLQKLFEDLGGLGVIESAPLQEGRNMSMLLAPSKEARAAEEAATVADAAEARRAPLREADARRHRRPTPPPPGVRQHRPPRATPAESPRDWGNSTHSRPQALPSRPGSRDKICGVSVRRTARPRAADPRLRAFLRARPRRGGSDPVRQLAGARAGGHVRLQREALAL